MKKEDYQISFNVPAFLGDANQESVWRTPPFKALIQHWWRIAVAKEHNYSWQDIRETEGRLFGHAWLKDSNGKDWAMRSRVRIKLEHHNRGGLIHWENSSQTNKVIHPEVKDRNTGKLRSMLPETYLAYGPLHFRDGLVHSPAIKAEENNQLTLIHPIKEVATFEQVMQLIHWFGTLGGRSRNGWGSLNILGNSREAYPILNSGKVLAHAITRPLSECLKLDWPHAIGTDEQGLLIWQTPERDNWQLVIKDLAQTKIKFRTDLSFPNAAPGGFEQRHLLAYPVTNHKIHAWGNTGRLANQVRFKVTKTSTNKFMGIIVHLPCGLPSEMSQLLRNNAPSIQQQIDIWQHVHNSLNSQQDLKRIGK